MRNDTCIHCEYPIRNGECACTDGHNIVPKPARTDKAVFASTDWVAELGAVQTQLEDAWTALCKQDWGAATQNVCDVRASVTKLVESVRGHSATSDSTTTRSITNRETTP